MSSLITPDCKWHLASAWMRQHRSVSGLPLDRLGASDETVFLDLCRSLRLVCSRCGGRKMHVVPQWPDVRQKRAASMGASVGAGMSASMGMDSPTARGALRADRV